MDKKSTIGNVFSGTFAVFLFAIGVLNMLLVHPVPGIIYLLLSLLYLPRANTLFKKRFGFPIPYVVKILLGVVIIIFTLGVSDLGDMIDKL